MIQDLQQHLAGETDANGDDGQLFSAADGASEYGLYPYDLQAAGPDFAVGEPLTVFYRVTDEDMATNTSVRIYIVNDDDGAGTNEIELLDSGVKAINTMTLALGVRRLGTINPGLMTKRYIAVKVLNAGSACDAGKVAVWFEKGTDRAPANVANTI